VRHLLEQYWAPAGVEFPRAPLDSETVALIRVASGNFRLLNRLLTQIQRTVKINALAEAPQRRLDRASSWSRRNRTVCSSYRFEVAGFRSQATKIGRARVKDSTRYNKEG
jgi:hypothetical protein